MQTPDAETLQKLFEEELTDDELLAIIAGVLEDDVVKNTSYQH
jgi:hypothetical protein